MMKMTILISVRGAQQPNAGWNIQHMTVGLITSGLSEQHFWTKSWKQSKMQNNWGIHTTVIPGKRKEQKTFEPSCTEAMFMEIQIKAWDALKHW